MKKFRFTLQSLYDVKLTIKDKLQAEYAEAEAAWRAALERQLGLERLYEEEIAAFEARAREGVTASELTRAAAYHEDLRERIQRAKAETARTSKIMSEKREELVAVHKEIKVLERLQEKQYAGYLKELEKDEAKVMDSILSFQETEKKAEENTDAEVL